MRPETRDRLNKLSTELQAQGVVDIKFTVNPDCKDKEELASSIADCLELHLAGKCTPIEGIGDGIID